MFSRIGATASRALKNGAKRAFSTAAVPVAARSSIAVGAVAAALAASGAAYSLRSNAAVQCAAGAKIPAEGIPGTNYERTFIAIKPDGVQRGLIATIIGRFEQKGFTLVGMKMLTPTKEQAEGHYEDLNKKPFFKSLTAFFSSGPIVAMVWQGKGAILTGRKLLGETDPAKSAPGSIRGDFSIDLGRNIIHGSDGPEGAAHEIKFWFRDSEISDWNSANGVWTYEKP